MSAKKKKKEEKVEENVQPEEAQETEAVNDDQQTIQELKEQLQRLAADYQNYQKRSHKQIEQASQFAKQDMAKALLPILDNFDQTLSSVTEDQDVAAVLKGVKIVYDHMIDTLSGQSIQPIEVNPGDNFDPNLHEAMMRQESDEIDENCIIAEFSRGYSMGDIVLRPTKVSVARSPQVEATEAENESEED